MTVVFSSDNPALDRLSLGRSNACVSTELQGETVLLDLDSAVYSGFDAVGTRIWAHLEEGIVFGQLIRRLQDEYDVPREQCVQDVLTFLKQLQDQNLIIVHDE